MEHIKHFTQFVFESNMIKESNDYNWTWDKESSMLQWTNSKDLFTKNIVFCKDGTIFSGHSGMGKYYEYSLGIKCNPNDFVSKHEDIIDELVKLSPEDSHGIFWKPIEKNAKTMVVKAIKNALK